MPTFENRVFKKLSSRLIDEGWIAKSQAIPDFVYHYTNASGLVGLLNTKCLWLTDYRFMNDAAEVSLGTERARAMLKDKIYKENDGLRKKFLSTCEKQLREDGTSFVFSLTEKKDDLSQWRGYANEGRGFSVGFDTKSIRDHSAISNEYSFGKISYNGSLHDKQCNKAVDEFLREYSSKTDLKQIDTDDGAYELSAVLDSYAAKYKHSSFSSEKEWRLHSYSDDNSEIKVRVSDDKLIPYIEMDISSDSANFTIRQIGIGPGFKSQESAFAVERLCAQYGIDVEVYFADSPYRSL